MYEIKSGSEILKKYVNTIQEALTVAISNYHQGYEVIVRDKETRELILSLMDEGYGGVYVSPKVKI